MTRRPFDPRELDGDADLSSVTDELERYARLSSAEHPRDLSDRVMAQVAHEPTPRRGLLATLAAPFSAGGSGIARVAMVGATMAIAVIAVVIAGQLADLLRTEQVGPSPAPSVISLPSATPSPTPTPTVTPSPSPTATPSPTASPTPAPPTASPDDETPEATESPDDEDETPEPTDDDNSGPGGGGDDGD